MSQFCFSHLRSTLQSLAERSETATLRLDALAIKAKLEPEPVPEPEPDELCSGGD